MKICIYEKSVEIDASIETVFAFHENPENLRKISPASLKVKKIIADAHAVPGGTFELQASQFGLPIHWIGRWEVVDAPQLLVDVGVRCPFPFFRHTHRFDAISSEVTRMTDRVEYGLPLGWIGWLAGITGGRIVLASMFAARHLATRAYFSNRCS